VDAVGEIIWAREKERFPIGVGAFLAFLLHLVVAAAFVYSSMVHPVRFVSPRAVSVRLMPAGSLQGGAAPPAPAPLAPPETKKILKPAPEDEPPPPSEKAMLIPSKDKEKKTAPPKAAKASPAPDVSLPSQGGGSEGTGEGPAGMGGKVAVGVSGATFDSDFPFAYYIERMMIAISLNWIKPNASGKVRPVIHFKIARDGTISDAEVIKSSGLPFVDRAALRAVVASSPLPPLPTDWEGNLLGISVAFN
jgi:periplasmic protein TonB